MLKKILYVTPESVFPVLSQSFMDVYRAAKKLWLFSAHIPI